MDIFRIFRKKTLSADVIALLAQAHSIHQAELEMARDEVTAHWRQKVRDALMQVKANPSWSAAQTEDRYRSLIGVLFAETGEQQAEWFAYLREYRQKVNDQEYERLYNARQRERQVVAQAAVPGRAESR